MYVYHINKFLETIGITPSLGAAMFHIFGFMIYMHIEASWDLTLLSSLALCCLLTNNCK